MAWIRTELDDYIANPENRSLVEEHIRRIAPTNPVKAARWQAKLDGDEPTARRIWLHKQIFRVGNLAKSSKVYLGLLDHLKQRLKEVDGVSDTV